jgi:lipoyl(octanoyl) transferase
MPKNLWRLVRSGPLPGALNMALDEALLNSVAAGRSHPVLRLYRWDPPAVSLGYFQRGPRVINLAYCQAEGIDVVRRMTGGRAVLHDREVTYSIIAGVQGKDFSNRVLDNYRRISEALELTLKDIGLDVMIVSGRSHHRPGDAHHSACFAAPSSYELLCRGCKIAGSAQKCQGEVFLQHGSLPVDLDPVRLFCALDTVKRFAPMDGGRNLARKIGWINRWLDLPVTLEEVENFLIASTARVFSCAFVEQAPSDAEWRDAEDLVRQRYGNQTWNLRGIIPG